MAQQRFDSCNTEIDSKKVSLKKHLNYSKKKNRMQNEASENIYLFFVLKKGLCDRKKKYFTKKNGNSFKLPKLLL